MNCACLVTPSLSFKEAFQNYYKDYLVLNAPDEQIYRDMYRKAEEDFEGYLQFIEDRKNGIGLPEGWTATHTFWLVDQDAVVGVLRIRPELLPGILEEVAGHMGYDIGPSVRGKGYGKTILKLGLSEAKRLGLSKALVVCNVDNEPSRKIIEVCGGIYDSDIAWEDGVVYSRYWVPC